MPKTALLTPVVNFRNGWGPGHSALVIGPTVYSFGDNGGWYVVPSKTYMAENTMRPVLVQHLDPGQVDGDKMLAYVTDPWNASEWYVFSGVCSTQAAYAIAAATGKEFDAPWFDTPIKIAALARDKGYVQEAYVVMPSETLSSDAQLSNATKILDNFPNAKCGMPQFYDWK